MDTSSEGGIVLSKYLLGGRGNDWGPGGGLGLEVTEYTPNKGLVEPNQWRICIQYKIPFWVDFCF